MKIASKLLFPLLFNYFTYVSFITLRIAMQSIKRREIMKVSTDCNRILIDINCTVELTVVAIQCFL